MNPAEAVILARYVRALCPQQKFDEYTPDAWYDVLAHHDLEDCKQASAALASRQPFIAPAEIIGEVKALRRGRLENFRYEPVAIDETPEQYLTQLREQLAATAAGRRPAALLTATPARPMRELLAAVGRHIPAADRSAHETVRRPGPLSVRCPRCHAALGKPCKTTLRGRPMADVHPARADAFQAL